jgi:hypothetical protein
MPSTFILTALQWAITLSGVVTFVLAGMSWRAAHQEVAALKRTGQNGCLLAAAWHHLICASTRLIAAMISAGGGGVLVIIPDFVSAAGVLAGACWLSYNWLLIINLSVEGWVRLTMRKYHTAEGVL